jgi:hypothetical protein
MAKKKTPKVDGGIDAKQLTKIRSALRQIWRYSLAHKITTARCVGRGGFSHCEKCGKRAPKVYIDHIVPVGDLLHGGIERLFVASSGLQGLCKPCHAVKTKIDNAVTKRNKVKRRTPLDFF